MTIDFNQYLRAVQKYWWLALAIFLLSVGAGLAFSYSQTPVYEGQIAIVASLSPGIVDTGDLIDGLNTLDRNSGLVTTSCEILESQTIIEQAAQTLGIPVSLANEYRIDCVVLPGSTVLQVSVQGPSPELVTDLANTIGVTGIAYVNNLYEVIEFHLLDFAENDLEPISPDHLTNVALSAIIGLIAAIGFIVLRQILLQYFTDHG